MIAAHIEQFHRVWAHDRKLRRVGFARGSYATRFYNCRLIDRLPGLVRARETTIRFTDGLGGSAVRRARIRIDAGGGDAAVMAGVLGDLEYWDPALYPARRILDVGANIGLTALWFSLVSPGVEIACVEPDPRNIPFLRRNLAANGLVATILPWAVGGRSGEVDLAYGPNATCSVIGSVALHQHARTARVPLRTFGEVLDRLGWESVDLVKMDIEGAEKEIFASCGGWIDRVGRVVLEVHPNTSSEEIDRFVAPYGLRSRLLGHESSPIYVLDRPAG